MLANNPLVPVSSSPAVHVAHGGGPYGNTRRALEPVGLSPVRGKRVLLKPNVGRVASAGSGIVTHPEVVAAAIDAFRAAGADVAVGESPIVGVKVKEAFEAAGVTAVAGQRDCPLIDMDRRRFVELPVPEGQVIRSLQVCPEVLEFDFVVSIPVMKMHMHTGVSLAVKNMKGCLWRRSKVELHMLPPVAGGAGQVLGCRDCRLGLRPAAAVGDYRRHRGAGRPGTQRGTAQAAGCRGGQHRRLCRGRRGLPIDGHRRGSASRICGWAPNAAMASSI